jgi:hypothetical protein
MKGSVGLPKRAAYLAVLVVMLLVNAQGVFASGLNQSGGAWWEVTPEPEIPSPQYDSMLYSEIAPRLREIETTSNRVKVEVLGQSAGGRNMFLVVLSAPEAMGRLGQYQAIRNTMLKDPNKAQEMIDRFGDFKVPIFINGSIHGNEYPGTDAAMRLIETLAYDSSPETMEILQNAILLINVVQNPDGRVLGTRANANGIDINRDFITQSQPETRATVKLIKEWNPMVVLDLHGFVNPMLIEPCTPPHNPNYEYDLYIKWALDQAEAMEAELFAQTGFRAQIPFRDDGAGWDDWPPTYTPMYSMYHGAYGHTLETPYRDARGVDAHYAAVWGALKFAAANRQAMVRDQIEIFRRGFFDLPQMPIPDEILDRTQYEQYNWLTVNQFPAAYIIPQGAPFQLSQHQPAQVVEFLLANDVQVSQASQPFSYGGSDFPAGTYIVWMDQPKRGLANTILDAGPDLSSISGLTFYSPPAVWSNPLLWGAARYVMEEKVEVKTNPVNKADLPRGSISGKKGAAYAYQTTSLNAIRVTNQLLARGVPLQRMEATFTDRGQTFAAGAIIVPGEPSLVNELANQLGLDLTALDAAPADAVTMRPVRVATRSNNDYGLLLSLRSMGYDVTELSVAQINAGALGGYDVFLNQTNLWGSLNTAGRASFTDFLASGGDYIGLWSNGARIFNDSRLAAFTYASASGNAIARLTYDQTDPLAAGFWAEDYAFVYTPVWYNSMPENFRVTASYKTDDMVISGYWPNWQASPAKGKPAIIQGKVLESSVTLIGIDPAFRSHPENTFRLLSNAFMNAID